MVQGISNVTIDTNLGQVSNLNVYIPTVTSLGVKQEDFLDINTKFTTGYTLYTTDNQLVEHYLPDIKINFVGIESLFSCNLSTNEVAYFLSSKFTVGLQEYDYFDTNNSFILGHYIDTLNYLKVDYILALVLKKFYNDLLLDITIYERPFENTYDLLDIFSLARSYYYTYLQDIYCAYGEISSAIEYDVQIANGRIAYLKEDIFNVAQQLFFTTLLDIFSSKKTLCSIKLDIQNTVGNLLIILQDVYAAELSLFSSTKMDIRIHSLEITNFSLHYGKYAYFGDQLSVDIIDHRFVIDTTKSYFKINNHYLTSVFQDISYGKRMTCIIDASFISTGKVVLEVVAYNNIGDKMIRNYGLLFGYSVEYFGNHMFGYANEVAVRGCGTNLVSCPNTECGAFIFTTKDYPSRDLNACISCVVSDDLTASIYPQSTAFFYGHEYLLTISGVKDYAGNYMSEIKIKFKIEEKSIN